MARSERNQPRVFIHLPHHIHGPDDAQPFRIHQPHLDALLGQRHPRIDVRRVIVEINEDVIAAPKFQAARDKAQSEGCGPDKGRFLRLAIQKFRHHLPAFGQNLRINETLLVVGRRFAHVIGHGIRGAARQRAITGVGEKNFICGHRELATAQALIGQNFV